MGSECRRRKQVDENRLPDQPQVRERGVGSALDRLGDHHEAVSGDCRGVADPSQHDMGRMLQHQSGLAACKDGPGRHWLH